MSRDHVQHDTLGRMAYDAWVAGCPPAGLLQADTWEELDAGWQELCCRVGEALTRAAEEADRAQLVEALGLHRGTSWGEAVEEGQRLQGEIARLCAELAATREALAAQEAIVADLAQELVTVEMVLDDPDDAAVEEGEVAERVLAVVRERDAATARPGVSITLHLVVDTDGHLEGWACPPHGPEDAMADVEADIRSVDLEEHGLPEGRHDEQVAQLRALGVVEVEVRAPTVEGVARACTALLGDAGHAEVAIWAERVRAALGAG